MAEINKRDTKWLWTGKPADVLYPDDDFVRKEKKANRQHELRTAQRIAANGLKVEFQYDEELDKTKKQHTKTGYSDLKDGTELKTPIEAKSEWSAVKNAYENSLGKIGVKRLLIDVYEDPFLSDEKVFQQIREQQSKYKQFNWVSMINHDGVLIDVVKS